MKSVTGLKKFQKMYLIRVEGFLKKISETGDITYLEKSSNLINAAIKKQRMIDSIEKQDLSGSM